MEKEVQREMTCSKSHISLSTELSLDLGFLDFISLTLHCPGKEYFRRQGLKLFYKNLAHSHILNMGF